MNCNEHKQVECDSCKVNSQHVAATTKSINLNFSEYDLCQECADEYDSRQELER